MTEEENVDDRELEQGVTITDHSESTSRGPEIEGPSESELARDAAVKANFTVFVCNRSSWTITHIIDDNGNETRLNPPLGRTCSADINTCVAQKKFKAVKTVDCKTAAFGIGFRATHPAGLEVVTGQFSITPNCINAGTVLNFEMFEP